MAESSKEGYGSERAVLPVVMLLLLLLLLLLMMMMMIGR
jgi:hypothetical protein